MNGIFLIDKEEGMTSQTVCSILKRKLHLDKVGHTGTLDPFATGLMVVTVNEATKLASFLDEKRKTYLATLKLGIETNTGDKNGEFKTESNVPVLSMKEIESVLTSFIGKSKQVPPMTSAIHVNGVKLYQLAHQGIEVEREPREIEVYSIKLISYEDEVLVFECEVSKGTYIRVLGEDIAKKLNTVGHLLALRRLKAGLFSLEKSKKVNDINIDDLTPINDVLSFMDKYIVDDEQVKKVKNGHDLVINSKGDIVAVYKKDMTLLAIYRKDIDNLYRCQRGFNIEDHIC